MKKVLALAYLHCGRKLALVYLHCIFFLHGIPCRDILAPPLAEGVKLPACGYTARQIVVRQVQVA